MTSHERIVAALQRRQPDRVPTFEWSIDPRVCRALTGSEDALEAIEALDIDAVAVRADYGKTFRTKTEFVDEWGATRRVTEDVLAATVESPIPDIARHGDFRFPDPHAPHRFAGLEKALTRFAGKRAVILNLRDGFSDMRDMLGYENCLVAMMLEERHFADLLDRAVDYNLTLARIARERFAVGIIATTDDIANNSGLLFSPEVFFRLVAPRFRRVIQGFKSLGYLCIKHSDGDINAVVDWWLDSGVDCIDPIDPGAGLHLQDFKRRFGARVCLKGNVDCTGPLVDGSVAEVEREVRTCIEDAGAGGGFILSSSNTIHSGVKPSNYTAMLKALREYGRY